jgi:hypothetical protein
VWRDPYGYGGRNGGGLMESMIALLVVLAILPIITPYVVAIGLIVITTRLVWFFTR